MEDLLKPLFCWAARLGLVQFSNALETGPELGEPFLKRPLFWWSTFVFLLQIIHVISHFTYAIDMLKSETYAAFIPPFLRVMVFVIVGFLMVFCLVPRIPFMKYKKLVLTVRKLNEFDSMFAEQSQRIDELQHLLEKRRKQAVLIGTLWVLFFTGLSTLLSVLALHNKSAKYLVAIGYIEIMQTLGFGHCVITKTMYFLGELAVAYRLKLLKSMYCKLVPPFEDLVKEMEDCYQPNRNTDLTTTKVIQRVNNSSILGKKLSREMFMQHMGCIKQSLHKLQEASKHLNDAYSLIFLLILTCELFVCSIGLCHCIFVLLNWKEWESIVALTFSSTIFLSVLGSFLIVTLTADKPVAEWEKLRKCVSRTRTIDLTEDEKIEVTMFLKQIQIYNFAFSAAGMFHVGRRLIPGISAAVLTYIVIMLQASLTS